VDLYQRRRLWTYPPESDQAPGIHLQTLSKRINEEMLYHWKVHFLDAIMVMEASSFAQALISLVNA
jgi:hypothetical protein